jgi:hypothetical protein
MGELIIILQREYKIYGGNESKNDRKGFSKRRDGKKARQVVRDETERFIEDKNKTSKKKRLL